MDYPTPNPGPCSRCGTRIWHGGTLCSECSSKDAVARTKQDKAAKQLKRLEADNAKLKDALEKVRRSKVLVLGDTKGSLIPAENADEVRALIAMYQEVEAALTPK